MLFNVLFFHNFYIQKNCTVTINKSKKNTVFNYKGGKWRKHLSKTTNNLQRDPLQDISYAVMVQSGESFSMVVK